MMTRRRSALLLTGWLLLAPLGAPPAAEAQLDGGPLLYRHDAARLSFGIRPLFTSAPTAADRREFDLLYPLLTHRATPLGYHGQLLLLIRWSSDTLPGRPPAREWVLFPLLAYQSATPESSTGFALFPLYGSLHRFLGQKQLRFTLFPLWLSLERNQVNRHYVLWPFFGWATAVSETAPPAHGWRFWPFYGELVQEGVKEERFALWPIFLHQRSELDSDTPREQLSVLPFYNMTRTPDEQSTWWLWPLFSHTVNTKTHYEEWTLPWPLVQFGSGDEKIIRRVFPFYSEVERTRTVTLLGTSEKIRTSSHIILWPLYHATSEIGPDWRRDRDRLLLWFFSDTRTQKANAPEEGRRIDLWPLFTYNKTPDGAVRFQTLALIEPFLNTEPITRNYSPLWSLASYRRDQQATAVTLLLGLFRWSVTGQERRLGLFYLPAIRWTADGPPPEPAASPSGDAP
jgi:hypothetical protein